MPLALFCYGPYAINCYPVVTRSLRVWFLVSNWEQYRMYIDPSAGSLILQLLAAGTLSVVAMVGRVREVLKSMFQSLLPYRRWAGKR